MWCDVVRRRAMWCDVVPRGRFALRRCLRWRGPGESAACSHRVLRHACQRRDGRRRVARHGTVAVAAFAADSFDLVSAVALHQLVRVGRVGAVDGNGRAPTVRSVHCVSAQPWVFALAQCLLSVPRWAWVQTTHGGVPTHAALHAPTVITPADEPLSGVSSSRAP
jgi:hypothetical protein